MQGAPLAASSRHHALRIPTALPCPHVISPSPPLRSTWALQTWSACTAASVPAPSSTAAPTTEYRCPSRCSSRWAGCCCNGCYSTVPVAACCVPSVFASLRLPMGVSAWPCHAGLLGLLATEHSSAVSAAELPCTTALLPAGHAARAVPHPRDRLAAARADGGAQGGPASKRGCAG